MCGSLLLGGMSGRKLEGEGSLCYGRWVRIETDVLLASEANNGQRVLRSVRFEASRLASCSR